MKKYFCLLLAMLLLLTAAGCGSEPTPTATPEPSPTVAPTPSEPDYEAASYRFAEYLIDGDYSRCLEAFADAALLGTTMQDIEDAWEPYAGTMSDFVGFETDRTMQGTASYMQYCNVFCEFDQGGLVLTVLFVGTEDVMGFVVNTYLTETNLSFETQSDATPLFWRVSSEDGGELYLLGSMHAAEEGMYGLSDVVMQAFDSSDVLALELDMLSLKYDMAKALEYQEAMFLTDGTTLADHLKPETYEKLVNFMASRGAWNASYDNIKPYLASDLIDQLMMGDAGLSGDWGIDMYFNSLSAAVGKPVLEVESMQQQLDIMLGAPDIYWDAGVNSLIDNYDSGVEQLLQLYQAYRSGDTEALMALVIDEVEVDDASLAVYTEAERAEILAAEEAFNLALLHDRNIGMAAKAEEYLKSGDTIFLVVGAGHMLGEGGLPALLAAAGYTVEQIEY